MGRISIYDLRDTHRLQHIRVVDLLRPESMSYRVVPTLRRTLFVAWRTLCATWTTVPLCDLEV